ncbi:MAG: alkene reductase [Bacteroidetes bacterium]|nr:alkene reductase [Bacteroidota bacterium]
MIKDKPLSKPLSTPHFDLTNRFVMAPLTRQRAGSGLVPHALNALYYGQRSSAGLIVSEASQISPRGLGYANTPGIYSEEQIEGWRLVTDAVHEKGGRIFCQLWHVGRHSHPFLQEDGGLPVAPSAVAEPGHITTPRGKVETVVPHALTVEEIEEIINDYRKAALNAIKAGFDGVEIHAANGYLIDQFLNDNSNIRTDKYGGNAANKCRFAIEVTQAITEAIGSSKVGIRLSPSGTNFGIRNENPVETFEYLVNELNKFDLAYIHLIEPRTESLIRLPQYLKKVTPHFRSLIKTTLITSAGYDFASADKVMLDGHADLVAFGKMYISNPDLAERYALDAPLTPYDENTFYGGGSAGYTDYPFFK